MSTLRIALIGHGKMGRAVEQIALERGHTIACIIDPREGPGEVTAERLAGADVAVEFSEPNAAAPNAAACVRAGTRVLVGTTGWYDRLPEVAREVARCRGALLWAPNFSLGIHMLTRIVRRLATLQPEKWGFAMHLVETHHAAKKDAPSGTALHLAAEFAAAGGAELTTTSVRVGSVPGRHELIVDGPFEQLRLVHDARDRRVFAAGAVTAAEWLAAGDRHGIFTLDDVLSENGERA
ncbi:MAG: 4-hydroxy-tetrahydrodipicolinate reductase [Gemmatimonadaceae bacterium]